MRIRLLTDSLSAADVQFDPRVLAAVATNDNQTISSPAPNPAETYLLSLAVGSRRTMRQALAVVANIIEPGAGVSGLNWARLGYADVANVRSVLASRYSPANANKILAALRGVLKATFRMGLMDADTLARAINVRPIRGNRISKGRSLQAIEVARLIAACDRTSTLGVRNATIVAVGVGCGLRRPELVGLDVNDVLEDGAALRVRGKGNKERIVYLADSARSHLVTWLRRRGDERGPLFCPAGPNGVRVRRLSEQTVYDVLQSLAKKAGMSHMAPHDLRRTFVSTLLNNGVPLSTVSAMAGHSSVDTTSRYDRRGERVKREASKLLDVAMPT